MIIFGIQKRSNMGQLLFTVTMAEWERYRFV